MALATGETSLDILGVDIPDGLFTGSWYGAPRFRVHRPYRPQSSRHDPRLEHIPRIRYEPSI